MAEMTKEFFDKIRARVRSEQEARKPADLVVRFDFDNGVRSRFEADPSGGATDRFRETDAVKDRFNGNQNERS